MSLVISFWIVIYIIILIVGYLAEIVIEIIVVDWLSASPGAGKMLNERRTVEPLCHDLKRRRVISTEKLTEWLNERWLTVCQLTWSSLRRKESADRIKSIVVMRHSILSAILGSWPGTPPTLPTPWMDRNSELRMAGDKHATGSLIGFIWQKSLSQWDKSLHLSLIFPVNFCWINILNYQLHHSHT